MPPQNNINRLPQVLLHFHLEEYITKSIMMLCILRVQQWHVRGRVGTHTIALSALVNFDNRPINIF